jgi:beta-aspartyl-dipeptidase (metallo-type)
MDVASSFSMAEVLAQLLSGPLDPQQFLPAFTSNPAQLLKLHGKGELKVGGPADLVVLGSDHLPRSVMAEGQWHLRDGKSLRKGLFEI